jgi:divalent metal cation (Fe/Co/Zn/Cd) transporter
MPALGVAKRRLGARLGSAATAGEGTQNLLCAYLAAAVLAGLLANTILGWWWLDPVVALGIAALAVREGTEASLDPPHDRVRKQSPRHVSPAGERSWPAH